MKPASFILLAVVIIALISAQFIIESTEITNMKAELSKQRAGNPAVLDSLRTAIAPGLGEYMMSIQQHHAKLWFAGINSNYELASYEIGELDELFENVARIYPKHDSLDMTPIIQTIRAKHLADVDTVIARHGTADQFRISFDQLNQACNGCHAAAQHRFIHIQPPTTPPATNQTYLSTGLE